LWKSPDSRFAEEEEVERELAVLQVKLRMSRKSSIREFNIVYFTSCK
jgi:hypothetical protein